MDEKMPEPPEQSPYNLVEDEPIVEVEPDLDGMDMDAWAEQEFGPEYQDPMVEGFEPERPLTEFEQYMSEEYPNYFRSQMYQENVTLDPPEMSSTWEPFEIDSSMVANANEAVAEMGVELMEARRWRWNWWKGGWRARG